MVFVTFLGESYDYRVSRAFIFQYVLQSSVYSIPELMILVFVGDFGVAKAPVLAPLGSIF